MKKLILALCFLAPSVFAVQQDFLTLSNNLRVDGKSDLRGDVTVDGATTLNGNLTMVNNSSISGASISGSVTSASLDSSSITKQGNTFNGQNQLVKTDSAGKASVVILNSGFYTSTGTVSIGTVTAVNFTNSQCGDMTASRAGDCVVTTGWFTMISSNPAGLMGTQDWTTYTSTHAVATSAVAIKARVTCSSTRNASDGQLYLSIRKTGMGTPGTGNGVLACFNQMDSHPNSSKLDDSMYVEIPVDSLGRFDYQCRPVTALGSSHNCSLVVIGTK